MDKRKVVEAYYRGLLTIEECAQILGSNRSQAVEMIDEIYNKQLRPASYTHPGHV
jgi:hypothetical protein